MCLMASECCGCSHQFTAIDQVRHREEITLLYSLFSESLVFEILQEDLWRSMGTMCATQCNDHIERVSQTR